VPVVFWPAGRSGRKLWKCLQMSELNSWDSGIQRVRHLQEICNTCGRPYTDFYSMDTLAEDWYTLIRL
jgi:hypothetical protein